MMILSHWPLTFHINFHFGQAHPLFPCRLAVPRALCLVMGPLDIKVPWSCYGDGYAHVL